MMGGGIQNPQNLLDLIVDPARMRAHIEELTKSTAARNKSIDEHKRAKEAHEVAMAEFEAKLSEHEAREREIAQKQAENDVLNDKLNSHIAACTAKQTELDLGMQKLAEDKAAHRQHIDKINADLAARHQILDQRKRAIEEKEEIQTDIDKRLHDKQVEIHTREQFLIACANEITKSR